MTCRNLLDLESFKGISLVAGASGLDHVISWPYPKHTKVISPWVQGGEFVLVSGYELGVNEEELLFLLDEAVSNHLSGILIEGGINFKSLGERTIQRADEAGIPLFFAPRVVSFLDICREISSLILEHQIAEQYTASLLEKVLSEDSMSRQNIQLLFESYGVPHTCKYKVFYFSVLSRASGADSYRSFEMLDLKIMKSLQTMCGQALQKLGIKPISWPTLNSVSYLVYRDSEEGFAPVLEALMQVRKRTSEHADGQSVTLALSSLIPDITGITEGFNQALYANSLMVRGLLPETAVSFNQLGSYQFPFYIKDKDFLYRFRDEYLKKLHDFDLEKDAHLLETLRVYLVHEGNMLRAADALFIHRNTLQYRLSRISAVTGKNLNDADVRRDFQNAFMLMDIYPFPETRQTAP